MTLVKVGDPYPWASPPKWGSVVMLGSGGPPMLIVDIRGSNRTCAWRAADKVMEGDWPYVCLKPVTA